MSEELTPIYSGSPEDFKWVGFGSGSGTNLRECAKSIKPLGVFSDRPRAKLFELEELADSTKIVLDGFEICGSWEKAKGNSEAESEYERRSILFNEEILEKLKEIEIQYGRIDLIVLGGYMRLIKDPLLSAYKHRIINIHPSRLPVVHGVRKYIGGDAVYDAIRAGERITRSSVIIVDKQEDHGEILVQGPELRVDNEFLRMSPQERDKQLREYVDGTDEKEGHQDRQKRTSDWLALTTALKLISETKGHMQLKIQHWFLISTVFCTFLSSQLSQGVLELLLLV